MRTSKQSMSHKLSHSEDLTDFPSRTKLHKQNHNNNMVTIILISIIVLIAVFALIYGLANNSLDSLGHRTIHPSKTRVSKFHHKKHSGSKHHLTENRPNNVPPNSSTYDNQNNADKSPQTHSSNNNGDSNKVTNSPSSNLRNTYDNQGSKEVRSNSKNMKSDNQLNKNHQPTSNSNNKE